MKYIVLEIQTDGDSTSTLINKFDDRNTAEGTFHTILGYAAVSAIPIHSAVMLTDEGNWLRSECYKH